MTFHDLTMTLSPATPVFPGDPEIVVSRWEPARPWHVTSLAFGSHAGTHMDAPRHLLPDGSTIDAFGPDRWFGEAVVIPVPGLPEDTPIPRSILESVPAGLLAGRFALLSTGWDRRRDQPAWFRHPWPSEDLARDLLAAGATLIGIDAPSVDSTVSGADRVHRVLLGAGVPVVENLCRLDRLPALVPLGACFAPLPLAGVDGAPVRAIVWDLDPR